MVKRGLQNPSSPSPASKPRHHRATIQPSTKKQKREKQPTNNFVKTIENRNTGKNPATPGTTPSPPDLHNDHAFRTKMRAQTAPIAPVAINHHFLFPQRDRMVSPVPARHHTAAAGCAPFGKTCGGETGLAPGERGMRADTRNGTAPECLDIRTSPPQPSQ